MLLKEAKSRSWKQFASQSPSPSLSTRGWHSRQRPSSASLKEKWKDWSLPLLKTPYSMALYMLLVSSGAFQEPNLANTAWPTQRNTVQQRALAVSATIFEGDSAALHSSHQIDSLRNPSHPLTSNFQCPRQF